MVVKVYNRRDMGCCPGAPDLIDLFALVTYLPNPLGAFLNMLRQELVPSCHLRAHVTVLPPRHVSSQERAWEQLQRLSVDLEPIEIELGDIEVFPETFVIYSSVRRGHSQLIELHNRLANEALAFNEPFRFHPHVTLAQGLTEEQVAPALDYARERWRNFGGSKSFLLDSMTFVKSADRQQWQDLGEINLRTLRATG